jgi:hypothetical protein
MPVNNSGINPAVEDIRFQEMRRKTLEETRILSWNIRAVGPALKKENLSDMIRQTAPDVILLQETKIGAKNEIESCVGVRYQVFKSSETNRGGVVTCIRKELLHWKKNWEVHVPQYLTSLDLMKDKRKIKVVNMYYPGKEYQTEQAEVETKLAEILRKAREEGMDVILGTDGNDWGKCAEKVEGTGLVDVATVLDETRGAMTFKRKGKDDKWHESKIDMVLISSDLRKDHFGHFQVFRDEEISWNNITDHAMMILDLHHIEPGKGQPTVQRTRINVPTMSEVAEFEKREPNWRTGTIGIPKRRKRWRQWRRLPEK